MEKGKKIRVAIKTARGTYEGDFLIPSMRNRISDVLNEEDRVFINLTDVTIDGGPKKVPFVSLNKSMIESIIEGA